jgi:hypothetical protein
MKQLVVTVLFLVGYAHTGSSTLLTYELLPGSTIYPQFGATQIGPAESLTGGFQVVGDDGWFQAFSFNMSSASYSLTLDSITDPTHEVGFRINPNPAQSIIFGGIVDMTGLSISQGQMGNFLGGVAYFTGPPTAPTFLDLQGLTIAPDNGGYWVANVSFTAELVTSVPDKTATASLLLLGMASCISLRWLLLTKRKWERWV